MKITKRQLRRIIREAASESFFSDREANPHDGGMYGEDEEDRQWTEAEYDRGYQDGLEGFPRAGDASTDYDVGYEDGSNDSQLPESRHISLFKRMLLEREYNLGGPHIPEEELSRAADDLEAAFKDGPEGVRAFMDDQGNKDPAVKDVLVMAAEEYDGSDPDDKVAVGGETPISVSTLAPTQQFIDLMQSVSFPLGAADQLSSYITTKTTGAPGAISIAGDAILDGHHRWSGVFAITPDGTVLAKDFDFPGSVRDKLAAAQLAVAAVNHSATHPSKGGTAATDIVGKGKEAISKMIAANAGKQTDKNAPGPLLNDDMIKQISTGAFPDITDWAGLTGDEEFVPLHGTFAKDMSSDPIRKAIADTVAGNLAGMPAPKDGAPESREDMPQLDHPSIGKDAGLAKIAGALPAGELNVHPPFYEGVMSDHDEMIIENWRRLAGINKL